MCGRVWQTITVAEIRRLFNVTAVPELIPRYNLAPSQDLLMVSQDRERVARLARWGLQASSDQPARLSTFNARLETVERSPLYAEAFRARRALIPVSGLYEWNGPKGQRQPLGFTRTDGRPLVCAALWAEQNGVLSCTILTTTPVGVFAGVHDRMPLLLPRDRWAAWLDPRTPPAQVWALANAAHDLHRAVHAYLVSAAVGNVRNDSPELAEPLRQLVSH